MTYRAARQGDRCTDDILFRSGLRGFSTGPTTHNHHKTMIQYTITIEEDTVRKVVTVHSKLSHFDEATSTMNERTTGAKVNEGIADLIDNIVQSMVKDGTPGMTLHLPPGHDGILEGAISHISRLQNGGRS